jgi:hypothetical protein
MPTLATKELVLNERTQVISCENDPEVFLLRLYVEKSKAIRQRGLKAPKVNLKG